MSGTTWSKFYWADWESDEKLKMCSPGAQALWMRMLCICAKSDGYLVIAGRKLCAEDMAAQTGWPAADVRAWWAELVKWDVFSTEGRGKVYSRKMVKDVRKAEIARANGKTGGNPSLRKDTASDASDNPEPTNLPGSLPLTNSQKETDLSDASASSRQLTLAKPNGFARFWEAYPNKVGKRAAEVAYPRALRRAAGPDPPATILAGVERAMASRKWAEGYIPNPATWLNQDRWLDEPETPVIPLIVNPNARRSDPPPTDKRTRHEANMARAFRGADLAAELRRGQ